MPNTCPTTPFSNEESKLNEKSSQVEKKQSPFTPKTASTRKSKKTTDIVSPYSKFSVTANQSSKYTPKTPYIAVSGIIQGSISSYIPKHFCPIPFLLIDGIHALLIDNSAHKLYINGRL